MISNDFEIVKCDIYAIWKKVCSGLPTRIEHRIPHDVGGWVRYIHGDWNKYIRLPLPGGPQLPWGSRPFYPKGVYETIWEELRQEWYQAPQPQSKPRLRLVKAEGPVDLLIFTRTLQNRLAASGRIQPPRQAS